MIEYKVWNTAPHPGPLPAPPSPLTRGDRGEAGAAAVEAPAGPHARWERGLSLDQLIELYVASTLGERRPVDDRERMKTMLEHANLIVTAWEGDLLVGVSRSITDWVWTTYLADLAVRLSHQRQGIGKELMRLTQAAAPQAKLLLLAAPAAAHYYGHAGFTNLPNAWWLLPDERITP